MGSKALDVRTMVRKTGYDNMTTYDNPPLYKLAVSSLKIKYSLYREKVVRGCQVVMEVVMEVVIRDPNDH